MANIIKGPYLQWPTQTTMTIMWETDVEASSEVDVFQVKRIHRGLSGKFKTLNDTKKTFTRSPAAKIHAVTVTDLEPETSYHYRVRSIDSSAHIVESDLYPFKTAVQKDTPFSFAVTSETGGYGNQEINEKLISQIDSRRPDFLLLVGDVVKEGLVYEQWDKFLFNPGKLLFVDTPFYLCLGNHERCSPLFYQFTHYPEPQNFYCFDYGNARFIALDCTSKEDYKGDKVVPSEKGQGFMPGSAQYEFLENSLKNSDATWKIVFFHYPPYVSGDYQVDEMRVLCPLFERYGVDIVFNSHTIVYERSHPIRNNKIDMDNGVIYVVAGGAGAYPQWFHHKRAWHTAQALAVPHFVQVIISQNVLELHAIDLNGNLFDMTKLYK